MNIEINAMRGCFCSIHMIMQVNFYILPKKQLKRMKQKKKETNRMKMKFDGAVTTEDEETEEDYDKNVTCNKIAPN